MGSSIFGEPRAGVANVTPAVTFASGRLPVARPAGSELPFYDTSGDGFCTSLDALLIINDLNNRPVEAQGEGELVTAGLQSPPVSVSGRSVSDALEIALSDIASDVWINRQRRGRIRGS